MINPNFDTDKLPDNYYQELKDNGWLCEGATIEYVSTDDFGTATTVLKHKDSLVILRQFLLAGKVHFSVDFEQEFNEIGK